MEGLIERIAALEQYVSVCDGVGRDFRVILMQIARAEEKILRIERGSSWTHPSLGLLTAGDQ